MSASINCLDSHPRSIPADGLQRSEPDLEIVLERALQAVHRIVPPLWPLADYVAVNPCFGLADRGLLSAHQLLSSVRGCTLLMPREYFQTLLSEGRLTTADIQAACEQCLSENPSAYQDFDPNDLTKWLQQPQDAVGEDGFRFRTVAEAVDLHQASSWSSHIINDISRHCATHFDEGQASWGSPWRGQALYTSWREAAQLSLRMDYLGLPAFRAFVASLPADPRVAIKSLMCKLGVPAVHWQQFLLCEVFSVAGWAAYARYRVREAQMAGRVDHDLIGLLAMRLAYDVMLSRAPGIPWPLPVWPKETGFKDGAAAFEVPSFDILARHVLQVALEQKYRNQLLRSLARHTPPPRTSASKNLQMIFCIDVRSEVFRRNLETLDDSIETFGFAGFFGLPLEYVRLGAEHGRPQCPVLLRPNFQVHEKLRGASRDEEQTIAQKQFLRQQAGKGWKAFQSSATSCFTFVESLGLAYIPKLLSHSLRWTSPSNNRKSESLPPALARQLAPDIHCPENDGLDETRRIDLAEGMLRNLGLTCGFARIVAVCGHASEVTNNPYRAALDCGACGGHSGEPNARVAAALLNDPGVRNGLESRGIAIPHDTRFIAAVHNTTTDEIRLCDVESIRGTHGPDIARAVCWMQQASQLSRLERSTRLGSSDPDDILKRSRDWSEVRPEWGLAGNATFLVAPRSRTAGLHLGGRAFMHSYDHRLDPDLKVLELIMTAPMVVTNWINMQYYASTVDPAAFGSGNKAIHNVVGRFGILQGNGGDLMTGLPWQSIHDGRQLQHEPLRLLVVINAPRASVQQIIEKHSSVRDLATNGWVSVVAWEGSEFYRWTAQGNWELQSAQ